MSCLLRILLALYIVLFNPFMLQITFVEINWLNCVRSLELCLCHADQSCCGGRISIGGMGSIKNTVQILLFHLC